MGPVMVETWKAVVGFEGLYEVSDWGRVRSLDRISPKRRTGRILKPGTVKSGHQIVVLGRGNSRLVHALVLTAFVGPRPAGADSCHADGDAANNHLLNLRWGTRSDNVRDMMAHGRTRSGLCAADVSRMRSMFATMTNGEIAAAFGVTSGCIGLIRHGHTWSHVA
jgi:hypothetical protein